MSVNKLTLSPRVIIQLLIVVLLVPLLPILISGRWGWWEGWVYAAIATLGFVISRVLASRAHPDLLAERSRFADHQDAKSWDKILARIVGLGAGLVPLAVGLEHRLGQGVEYSLSLNLLGLILLLAGYLLGTWALIANRYFSGVVRIQHDRGHQVVSGGPYALIRHPGYFGALLSYIGTPLFLDAGWTFLTVAFLIAALVLRTSLEDRTLQKELPGYREYAGEVRYRLIPGIW